jgi:rare lipoprotein A
MKKAIALPALFTLFTVFPAIITFAQDIQQGDATWYEDDSMELNASHARHPPGTRLRVTNLNNQKEVYVTVTDRIQNSANRILDISQEAASLLGMNRRGTTPIRLVVIRGLMAEPPPPNQTAAGNFPDDSAAPYDAPVPEITAVPFSPDYGDDEEYAGIETYADNYDNYDSYNDDIQPAVTASVETPTSPPPPVRTFPQQPTPSKSQTAPAAQPPAAGSGDQVLLKKLVVVINGREQIIDIPDGVYIPLPGAGQAPSTPYTPPTQSYPPPPPSRPPVSSQYSPPPSRTMPAPPPQGQAADSVIKIIPKLPDPNSGKVYRVQVAAFARAALAQVCFERLKAVGFSPAYEKSGSLYRVVLSGIRAADVSYVAQRLTSAGFTEAWIREESRP